MENVAIKKDVPVLKAELPVSEKIVYGTDDDQQLFFSKRKIGKEMREKKVCHDKTKQKKTTMKKTTHNSVSTRKRKGRQEGSVIKDMINQLRKKDEKFDNRVAKRRTSRFGMGADDEQSSLDTEAEESHDDRDNKKGNDFIDDAASESSNNGSCTEDSESSTDIQGECLVDTDDDDINSRCVDVKNDM